MLTDVFYTRYTGFHLKSEFSPSDTAFLVQVHRLLVEQLFPYFSPSCQKVAASEHALKVIHDRLSMEIGVHELSAKYYSYQNSVGATISGSWGYDRILKQYLCASFQENFDVTSFLMRRISLLELGFRLREAQVSQENAELPRKLAEAKRVRSNSGRTIILPGDPTERIRAQNSTMNEEFRSNVAELNARFRQAGYPFHTITMGLCKFGAMPSP